MAPKVKPEADLEDSPPCRAEAYKELMKRAAALLMASYDEP